MRDIKLRKCPFCGGEAELQSNIIWCWVRCKNCESTSRSMSCEENAIKRWNTRKPMDDIVGKLEELHEYYINRDGIVGGNIGALAIKNAIEIVKECGTDGNSTTDN